MFRATQEIYNALRQDEDLKVFVEEDEDSSHVWLQFGLDAGGSYRIRFISRDNDNDVAVRIFGLVKVPEAQRPKVIAAVNELNCKYRFFKFCCDSDGDVNVEYDYFLRNPNPAASAHEAVFRLAKVMDEIYPVIMRAMWG